jgi:hypothetical protein
MSDTQQFLDEVLPRIHEPRQRYTTAMPVHASKCGRTPIRSPSPALPSVPSGGPRSVPFREACISFFSLPLV